MSLACITGDIVALGDGQVGTQQHEFTLKVGETVLYSKFGIGVTDIEIQGQEHILLREDDVIGVMPRSSATAADIPELRPIGDRILVKVGALFLLQILLGVIFSMIFAVVFSPHY